MSETNAFGNLVRKRREQLELGLRHLAARVRISWSYLSQLERFSDRMSPPSEGVLAELAEALELDQDELARAAGRVPQAVERAILRPGWFELIRSAAYGRPEVTADELARLMRTSRASRTRAQPK
jgi:HTH-type transcriptional regulator, competence development regulator